MEASQLGLELLRLCVPDMHVHYLVGRLRTVELGHLPRGAVLPVFADREGYQVVRLPLVERLIPRLQVHLHPQGGRDEEAGARVG